LDTINDKFDICFIEDPLWPNGYYVSNEFLQKLGKISNFVVVDRSIDSYRYVSLDRQNRYKNNFIILDSLSKEFGITFKGYIISGNDSINEHINYFYNSF
jgi:histidinol-phosphate/aromatic aminotransferase/cobyric acid decarboxylase-like protein